MAIRYNFATFKAILPIHELDPDFAPKSFEKTFVNIDQTFGHTLTHKETFLSKRITIAHLTF